MAAICQARSERPDLPDQDDPFGDGRALALPHHDIYSIEDLQQLISVVKEATEYQVPIGVKIAAVHNVGAIASGIVRAGADFITIDGFREGLARPRASYATMWGCPSRSPYPWWTSADQGGHEEPGHPLRRGQHPLLGRHDQGHRARCRRGDGLHRRLGGHGMQGVPAVPQGRLLLGHSHPEGGARRRLDPEVGLPVWSASSVPGTRSSRRSWGHGHRFGREPGGNRDRLRYFGPNSKIAEIMGVKHVGRGGDDLLDVWGEKRKVEPFDPASAIERREGCLVIHADRPDDEGRPLHYKVLNELVRKAMLDGETHIVLEGVMGIATSPPPPTARTSTSRSMHPWEQPRRLPRRTDDRGLRQRPGHDRQHHELGKIIVHGNAWT